MAYNASVPHCKPIVIYHHNVSAMQVGYTDRFNGVQETPIAAPNLTVKGKARLFVKAIPQARIAYVKYKQRVSTQ
jgi:hypothetical protein